MNSQAHTMLASQVLPLVTAAVARGTVHAAGSEDQEELKRDMMKTVLSPVPFRWHRGIFF